MKEIAKHVGVIANAALTKIHVSSVQEIQRKLKTNAFHVLIKIAQIVQKTN